MFLKDANEDVEVKFLANSTPVIKAVIGFCAVLVVFSILLIEPLLEIISYYVQISGY
ncbi:MAG: hypothetical protein ACNI3H_09200 [Halarcobacter ebronensis]